MTFAEHQVRVWVSSVTKGGRGEGLSLSTTALIPATRRNRYSRRPLRALPPDTI
jgi:hypothetical protein